MNCANIAKYTGWHCQEIAQGAIRLHSPATLGSDGEHVGFVLIDEGGGRFFLTDAHATVEHLVSMGAKLSDARLKSVQRYPGNHFAALTPDWEIIASGDENMLGAAIWEATAIALSLASKEGEWQPRTRQERFASKIYKGLTKRLGSDRVLQRCKLPGISGHQLEFPLGIARDGYIQAIQPIGLSEDGRPDWGFVYQCFGKFSDLKFLSDEKADNRLIVMEANNTEDWNQAASMLSNSARVIAYRTDADLSLIAA